ncbi:hypothetical protein SCUCBS95973_007683 [Sporothrix curviconia]|uniref:Uncharacterized protein n=1 Tax=Sporothrix curviconia TaxID=1260050 RepID=A0ABP0CFN3_9PEZI
MAVISEFLCDPMAAEEYMIQSIETAEAALCEYPGTDGFLDPTPTLDKRDAALDGDENADADAALTNTTLLTTPWHTAQLASRKIELVGAGNRDVTGTKPTVVGVLNAVNNGMLDIYYMRWINYRSNREIILEIDTRQPRQCLGRKAPGLPSGNVDNYIIFHLHIPIDDNSLCVGPGEGFLNWYPGVSALNKYHGQVMFNLAEGEDTDEPDPRVDFRLNGGNNPLNARIVALTCAINGVTGQQNRWYVSADRTSEITSARVSEP